MDGRLWMLTAVFMMMVVSFPAETSALRCLNCKGCSKFEDSQAVTCPSSADRCLVTISHFNPFLIWSLAKNFLLHIFTSFSFGARLFYSKKNKQTTECVCVCVDSIGLPLRCAFSPRNFILFGSKHKVQLCQQFFGIRFYLSWLLSLFDMCCAATLFSLSLYPANSFFEPSAAMYTYSQCVTHNVVLRKSSYSIDCYHTHILEKILNVPFCFHFFL